MSYRTNRTIVAAFSVLLSTIPPLVAEENCAPEGYEALFDGNTLDNWDVHPESVGHWKVLEGVIDCDAMSQAPDNEKHLWTKESFEDFQLQVEWRIKETNGLYPVPTILADGTHKRDKNGTEVTTPTPNADSGILLRGEVKSQCNIWCWPVGSGEVYGYRMDVNMPAEVRAAVTPVLNADNPVGEWNKFIITMIGDRLTVSLNGKTVIDNAQLPGIPARGPIGLQHHGGKGEDGKYNNASSLVQFRNIFIEEF